jgi:hypothetical protein
MKSPGDCIEDPEFRVLFFFEATEVPVLVGRTQKFQSIMVVSASLVENSRFRKKKAVSIHK